MENIINVSMGMILEDYTYTTVEIKQIIEAAGNEAGNEVSKSRLGIRSLTK